MIPAREVELLAACRLSEQQIADVLNISLDDLKSERERIASFREAIRRGRARGEAELRRALYLRAKAGDRGAYNELLRRETEQD